jgi:hypothetical protein
MEQVKGSRAEKRNIAARIVALFIICMLPLALIMWYLVRSKADINTLSLFFIILMPFFAFVFLTRRLLLRKKNIFIYSLADEGIYEAPETDPENKNLIRWDEIKNYHEGHTGATGAAYFKLKLRSTKEEIIFDSKNSGSQYLPFIQALKKYIKPV